jgi:hypothetical protein
MYIIYKGGRRPRVGTPHITHIGLQPTLQCKRLTCLELSNCIYMRPHQNLSQALNLRTPCTVHVTSNVNLIAACRVFVPQATPCTVHCKVLRKLTVTCRVPFHYAAIQLEAGTLCNFRYCYIKISATVWELCEAKWLDVEWTRLGFANMSCCLWPRYYRVVSDVYKLWNFIFIELHLAVWINLILKFFFLTVLTSFSRPTLWHTDVFVLQCCSRICSAPLCDLLYRILPKCSRDTESTGRKSCTYLKARYDSLSRLSRNSPLVDNAL